MAGICCRVVGKGDTPTPLETTSRPSTRRAMDIVPLKYMADMAVPDSSRKRPKLDLNDTDNQLQTDRESSGTKVMKKDSQFLNNDQDDDDDDVSDTKSLTDEDDDSEDEECPKYGVTSVCGRRRDMEDSVSLRPFFSLEGFHYFAVFDGHGCSHVATMCKERLHEIVNEEILDGDESIQWGSVMHNGFARMDEEVFRRSQGNQTFNCRCELQTPHCDAVGSTAIIAILTPDKIVVSNCGDSRAVLCRAGVAIPLSSDHKPDRPDELLRVESKGGRVIYWDGARVLGVLAMSRAIGDYYLKPFVISEPEVTVMERSDADECLILASDGLWDVVSNETACGVVKMCLKSQKPPTPPGSPGHGYVTADGSDRGCSDASILLTKLALARHSADNVSVVVLDLRKDQEQTSTSS
ncbi:protein phosphatase 2C 37 isoform X2 [Vigna radiata var. radiata]|uniref:protein-serine/threonine phosphatase n=1 Tax=Vigna radiata var. radiata TaxID=3916 RepID=A0A1S3TQU4_VIGRR|nr:protein phosphatase 2C 37 isoform X2 [Vigna radiata var. radiata]